MSQGFTKPLFWGGYGVGGHLRVVKMRIIAFGTVGKCRLEQWVRVTLTGAVNVIRVY